MSIFGKFLVEFVPPAESFVWKMRILDEADASTTLTFSTSFTSGDSAADIHGFLSTLCSRIDAVLSTYAAGGSPDFVADAEVFPTNFSQTFPVGYGTSSVTSVAHSTVVIGIGGKTNSFIGAEGGENWYFDSIVWSTTGDTILALLGFDETETIDVDSYTITSSGRPRYSWFPGALTYGLASGAGITSDTGWVPVDAHSRVISGSGNMRTTGPSRLQYTRRLRFEQVKRSEALELRHMGPIAFLDQWATKTFKWYPDRDVGAVGAAGTQGDPGPPSYHTDDDCDYWLCSLAKEPRIEGGSDPNWFTVTIDLNGEPA